MYMDGDKASIAWTGLPEELLLWEQFGDEYVVYNRRSGETHFLNLTAAEVLRILQGGPATLPAVAAQIRDLFDVETEEEPALIQHISRVIQEFDHVGLICPFPT
jgi:PqqD family protein of HPr-rel-A system